MCNYFINRIFPTPLRSPCRASHPSRPYPRLSRQPVNIVVRDARGQLDCDSLDLAEGASSLMFRVFSTEVRIRIQYASNTHDLNARQR